MVLICMLNFLTEKRRKSKEKVKTLTKSGMGTLKREQPRTTPTGVLSKNDKNGKVFNFK